MSLTADVENIQCENLYIYPVYVIPKATCIPE